MYVSKSATEVRFVGDLEKQIELLKECAVRTDQLNHRLVKAFKLQTIVTAIAIVIVAFIAFAYAFSTPYPEQIQQTESGQMQRQGGILQ